MVGVAGSSLGTKGDDRRGSHCVDDLRDLRAQTAQRVERREAAILEAEQVELTHAQTLGCAICLRGASHGELRARWYTGMFANAFGAIGGDDEMHLPPFARETRQQRAHDALVVGMREDCEQGTILLAQ